MSFIQRLHIPKNTTRYLYWLVFAYVLAYFLHIFYTQLTTFAVAHDDLAHMNTYLQKIKEEGRWINYLLTNGTGYTWIYKIKAPYVRFLSFSFFAYFLYQTFSQLMYRVSDGWLFTLLGLSIPGFIELNNWALTSFSSFFILALATLLAKRLPLFVYFIVFGILFNGCFSQFYFFLPLLYLDQVNIKYYFSNFKGVAEFFVLWVFGFLLGFAVAELMTYCVTGDIIRIAKWRAPRYIKNLNDLSVNFDFAFYFLLDYTKKTFFYPLLFLILYGFVSKVNLQTLIKGRDFKTCLFSIIKENKILFYSSQIKNTILVGVVFIALMLIFDLYIAMITLLILFIIFKRNPNIADKQRLSSKIKTTIFFIVMFFTFILLKNIFFALDVMTLLMLLMTLNMNTFLQGRSYEACLKQLAKDNRFLLYPPLRSQMISFTIFLLIISINYHLDVSILKTNWCILLFFSYIIAFALFVSFLYHQKDRYVFILLFLVAFSIFAMQAMAVVQYRWRIVITLSVATLVFIAFIVRNWRFKSIIAILIVTSCYDISQDYAYSLKKYTNIFAQYYPPIKAVIKEKTPVFLFNNEDVCMTLNATLVEKYNSGVECNLLVSFLLHYLGDMRAYHWLKEFGQSEHMNPHPLSALNDRLDLSEAGLARLTFMPTQMPFEYAYKDNYVILRIKNSK